jgi:BA14K-like protein
MSKKMGTVATAAIALAVLSFMPPAQAGHGSAVGAGIVGFGVGAVLGSALAPREVYVAPPPPPPPVYYGPVVYGPPAWTPSWYSYCARRYPGFDPQTGYLVGPGGEPVFCR